VRDIVVVRDHRHLRGRLVLYQDDEPLTEGMVQGLVRRAAQKAALFNNGPHMLRHTFCSHLAMRGAPARAIQELAGHQNLTTTQRYMHPSPAALDGAIRLLERPIAKNFVEIYWKRGIVKMRSRIARTS
jgi:site-specific recombinase XerD